MGLPKSVLGMPSKKKKKQKYGTLSQKVGGGPNLIPNFFLMFKWDIEGWEG